MNNLYSIQIGKNTYIDWCDKNWYGTITFPVAKFTREEALTIVKQLSKHFRYYVTISNNAETIKYEFGKEITYIPTPKKYTTQQDNTDTHEEVFDLLDW